MNVDQTFVKRDSNLTENSLNPQYAPGGAARG